MARSLWKGAISFGLVHIPVEMYSAVRENTLDLTMLDKRDFSPIGFKRYNKGNDKEVTWDDIVKGYEYSSGEYVVLSDEDLRRANPEATQTIDILAFVEAEQVPLLYYEQPYYLARNPEKGRQDRHRQRGDSGQAAFMRAGVRGRHHCSQYTAL